MLKAQIETAEVLSKLHELEHKAQHLPMEKVGEIFVEDTNERFAKHDWADLKTGGPATLIRTGALKESISLKVTDTEAEIGSPLDYASYLEEGTSKMPPREFIPQKLNTIEEKEIEDIISKHFEGN